MDMIFDLIFSSSNNNNNNYKQHKRHVSNSKYSNKNDYLPLPGGYNDSYDKYYKSNKSLFNVKNLIYVLVIILTLYILASIFITKTAINVLSHQDDTNIVKSIYDNAINTDKQSAIDQIDLPIHQANQPAMPPVQADQLTDTIAQLIDNRTSNIVNTDADADADAERNVISSLSDQHNINDKQADSDNKQFDNIDHEFDYNKLTNAQKLHKIRNSLLHGYKPYIDRCIGYDDINSLTGECFTWVNQMSTLIDSLSTLYIMNLKSEFNHAVNYVINNLQPTQSDVNVSFFETTIRVLGGLLSAYEFTNNQLLLNKAVELADGLVEVFDTESGLPKSVVNLYTKRTETYSWSNGNTLLSELLTFQVEFYYLSHYTHNNKYSNYANHVYDWLYKQNAISYDGLYPVYVNSKTGKFESDQYLIGGMSDSAYEYLLKSWLITGKSNDRIRQMYVNSMNGLLTHIYHTHSSSGASWIADLVNYNDTHIMQHLACFVPGLLALGVEHNVLNNNIELENKHLEAAISLTDTCYHFYTTSPTGLSAESYYFNGTTGIMYISDLSYKLRPEVLESIFIMYRLTGDDKYRQYGWTIYTAIEQHAKVQYGYSGLNDIRNSTSYDGRQESYFFAETLKYIYLLFSDDSVLPLTGKPGQYYVLNIEAHPLKSFTMNNKIVDK